ncbi:ATP-binding protein [Microcoleus sp. herbarium2]|uniref:ATP-binding protein n=1 Tax=Microcoleus sp. herbarium2 TaxID=3055433 RepID=UPI002FCF212F
MLCYPGAVNQLWTNRIYNVTQAMDNCRVLTVGVIDENPLLLLDVTDSCKETSPEILLRILERFFTTKKVKEGSRLGLDILKQIVEKHSVKIEVASVIGQTTFNVSISIAV